MPIHMNLSLQLADVTFGELYEFVAAAQAAGVPPEEKVRCLGSDDKGDRFEVDLSGREADRRVQAAGVLGSGRPVPQDAATSSVERASTPQGVAEFLRKSIRSESDVDKIISMLGEMRKFLR